MKYRLIALAAIAVAGHQNLMAGYRVIDGKPEVPYTAPGAPAAVPAVTYQQDQSERIRALEAENAQLRERLRDAEWQLGKRRSLSHEGAETAALGFELGSTKLNQPASKKAEILARARTASAIEIVGYTDNTGNDSINKRIALARAQLVKDMLVRNGISPTIIKVREQAGVYYAENDTAEGRAANRRAIVTFK